jgi:hypothetical protein
VQNIFHGRNNVTYSTNCKYRTATAIVNTLHKGDKDDDDNNNNNDNDSIKTLQQQYSPCGM